MSIIDLNGDLKGAQKSWPSKKDAAAKSQEGCVKKYQESLLSGTFKLSYITRIRLLEDVFLKAHLSKGDPN